MVVCQLIFLLLQVICSARGLSPQTPLSSTSSHVATIPPLGFGTWNIDKAKVAKAVSTALKVGYRHLDCAVIYGNQKGVGHGIQQGLKEAGISRESIWVTSKLWNDRHRPDLVEGALNETLAELGLEYLDLYLIHWPVASLDNGENKLNYLDTWRAMGNLLSTGKVRNIGVSNFAPHEVKRILEKSKFKPSVHQMELHPYLQQVRWVKWHQVQGINVTGYSPFGNLNPTYGGEGQKLPTLLENPIIAEIAKERGCSNLQVALAWGIGRGTSVIPKSAQEKHIRENFASSDCKLTKKDFGIIDVLGKKYVKRFNNPSVGWGVSLFNGLDNSERLNAVSGWASKFFKDL